MTPPDFLPSWPPGPNSFALFGLLLLAGAIGGRLAATTRVLPAITGYIATGFLLGPGGLHWLDERTLAEARVFADVSLGVIVFELGRRLDLEWARHDLWLLPMGLAESLVSFVAMVGLLRWLDVDPLEAAVVATFGIATAPAVVLLVTRELRAEGPVTRRALWHVALNNIVAILGLAVLLPFIEARATGAPWNPIARSLWLVAGSFLLGFVAFHLLTLCARVVGKGSAPQFILVVAVIILTVGTATLFGVANTIVQERAPDALRGRVSALNGLFIGTSNELGAFESGSVAQFLGPVASVVSGGIGTLLVVLGMTKAFPELLRAGRLDRPED